jgi:UDP-N-acetylmuramyl pentapeptide phosphotransferase/UDP-N-acetylglucosamine-1-phosphate transferase
MVATIALIILCSAIAFGTTALLMPPLIVILKTCRLFDRPVARSTHKNAKLKGAGWAVIPACLVLITSLMWVYQLPVSFYLLPVSALLLMLISWQDDLCHLCPGKRFLVQAVVVGLAILALPCDGYVFQGFLPIWLDRTIVFFALLWFVNLYNFMDGIDGLTAMQSIFLGSSIAFILMITQPMIEAIWPAYGMIIAGASMAFLLWNWYPARIFIGDVGAVPLGLLLGWYLLFLACQGQIWPACMLPLYYCFDATITLIRRLKQGHKPWEAHRFFFFQAAISPKFSQEKVVLFVLLQNVFLLICAVLASMVGHFSEQLPAILAAGFSVLALLSYFESKRQ